MIFNYHEISLLTGQNYFYKTDSEAYYLYWATVLQRNGEDLLYDKVPLGICEDSEEEEQILVDEYYYDFPYKLKKCGTLSKEFSIDGEKLTITYPNLTDPVIQKNTKKVLQHYDRLSFVLLQWLLDRQIYIQIGEKKTKLKRNPKKAKELLSTLVKCYQKIKTSERFREIVTLHLSLPE